VSDYIEDEDGAPIVEPEVFGKLIGLLHAEGGRLIIHFDKSREEWMVGVEFGQEAEDSDMAGGASYSLGPLPEAIHAVVRECRL
jgi:hypothetical protein